MTSPTAHKEKHGHSHGHDDDHHHHHHDHHHDEHSHDHHHHDHDHDHVHGEGQELPGLVRFLYIDPVAGAAGDMFLGALVDLGVDFDQLQKSLGKLKIPGFRLTRNETKRHTIAATKVDVVVEDIPHPHRHIGDLLKIVHDADLSERVKTDAGKALMLLAEAESAAHRMPLEKVHLHEVGGLDCLVDIVGTCIGFEMLEVNRIVSGPVTLGTGSVGCAHGRMPVPAPGTLRILQDFPVRKTNFDGEMTTPTGAAIIAALATPAIAPLVHTPLRIGYGAGSKDKPQLANMLRLVLAETAPVYLPKRPKA